MEGNQVLFDKNKIYVYFGKFGSVLKLIKNEGEFLFVSLTSSKIIPASTDEFNTIVESCNQHGELKIFDDYESMIIILHNKLKSE